MAKKGKKPDPRTAPDEVQAEEKQAAIAADEKQTDRGEELVTTKAIEDACLDLYKDVQKGFEDQIERSNENMDWWDIVNCKLGSKQFYAGNSRIFVPIVPNALKARRTRFVNQMFPQSGRHVEVTASEDSPHALVALLEHYIKKGRLRSRVAPALVLSGDTEGQYSIYVSWVKNRRHVVWKTTEAPELEGVAIDDAADEEIETIHEETVDHGYPHVEVISDADVSILPATADSVEDALQMGGSATIIRRLSKAKVEQMVADGEIDKDRGKKLLDAFKSSDKPDQPNPPKKMVDAAGISTGGGGKNFALLYETWTQIKVDEERRLCKIWYGGEDNVLSCKRNPYWSDKCPLISAPVEKVAGSFKGISKVKACADMQYAANDAVNEGMDSAAYALLPIIMTDPAKNPRVGSMVLNVAAIWETSPKDTQFAQFPQLWREAFEIVTSAKAEINQVLSTSPASIPQSTGLKQKRNQAEIAMEQQVDILTTADAVTTIENEILTPMLQRFIELDHQYRDEDLTIAQFGEMGQRAKMEKIRPVQMDRRFEFRWFGVEAARNTQQVQQQIALMNVLNGIPPDKLNGYKVNLVPLISRVVENTMGPRIAPLVFVSPEQQLPVPVEEEDLLLSLGFEVKVHELDDDEQHIRSHMMALNMGEGQNKKKFQTHIMAHIQQRAKKQQAQMQPPQGGVGMPGGAAPGVAGTPRPGAQPMMPRGGQNPAGAIHQDRMVDPGSAPRR